MAVLAGCPELDALTGHVRAFGKMLTQLQGDQLPQWIKAVRAEDLPSLHTFVNGLERDLAAVTAGLTPPWSSGVVEGHVNRIMIKRHMYGRAGFGLLPALAYCGSESCRPPDWPVTSSAGVAPQPEQGCRSSQAAPPGLS